MKVKISHKIAIHNIQLGYVCLWDMYICTVCSVMGTEVKVQFWVTTALSMFGLFKRKWPLAKTCRGTFVGTDSHPQWYIYSP